MGTLPANGLLQHMLAIMGFLMPQDRNWALCPPGGLGTELRRPGWRVGLHVSPTAGGGVDAFCCLLAAGRSGLWMSSDASGWRFSFMDHIWARGVMPPVTGLPPSSPPPHPPHLVQACQCLAPASGATFLFPSIFPNVPPVPTLPLHGHGYPLTALPLHCLGKL